MQPFLREYLRDVVFTSIQTGLVFYLNHYFQHVESAVPPVNESKTIHRVVSFEN